MGSIVHSWLERARDAAEAGDVVATRAALKEAFTRAPQDPDVWSVGGSCLLRAGSPEDALGCADRALEFDESHAPAHHLRFEARWALGNPHGALSAARKALDFRPDADAWRAQIVEHLLAAGDPRQAWGVASQNPDLESASEELLIAALRAAAGTHEGEVAPIASALTTLDESHRTIAWEALVEAGETDAARALGEAAMEPAVRHDLQARAALYAGDLASAKEHVDRLSEAGSALDADMFAGAIAVCEGKWEQAIAHLDRVLSERPIHSEAHCWRSEALRGLGSWEEAHGAAQTACNVSKGRHLAGEINQMLARIAARGQESDAVLDSHAIASLVHALLPLAPDFTIAWEGRVKVVRALLEHALERMAGNRSVVPTVIPEDSTGAWDRFTPGESPASRARRIQERLWSQSGERVLEDLERCALEHADDAEVRLIAGDTALWMGRWELAGSHFADGLKRDPGSYEARVGAAAVGLLSGDEEASSSALLELGRGPSESPAQLLWCAEALRRTGEMESADAHLRDLMERFGTYPAAWLNRGLIRDPVVALEELNGLVPVFVSDALRAVGVRMSEATGDPARASEVLEAGLEMIRGNRVGEVLTWFVADAGMRISAWRPQRDD